MKGSIDLLCRAVLACVVYVSIGKDTILLAEGAGVIGKTNDDLFSVSGGWTQARDLVHELNEFEEKGKGSPLWLVGLLPSLLSEAKVEGCNYPQMVATFFKAEKELKPFARLGMMRLVQENAEQDAFFQALDMKRPDDAELGCLSVLRFNARLARSNLTGVDMEGIDNPGLIAIGEKETDIRILHISTMMASSHLYSGITIESFEDLRTYGVNSLSMGQIPLVLYINPKQTAASAGEGEGKGEGEGEGNGEGEDTKTTPGEGEDSMMHSHIWNTLSNAESYREMFTFAITTNETLIDIPRKEGAQLQSPTYVAVLPMLDDEITFPYDVEGNQVQGVEIAMASFDNELAKLTEYEHREIGLVAHTLSKLKDWLDTIKSYVPVEIRESYMKKLAKEARKQSTQEGESNPEAETADGDLEQEGEPDPEAEAADAVLEQTGDQDTHQEL